MSESIPGKKARHIMISDISRQDSLLGGDYLTMIQLAMQGLYEKYPTGKGTRFHILITVDEVKE